MTRKSKRWPAIILCLAVAALAAACRAGDGADGSQAAGISSTAATNAGATPHPTSTPNDGVRRVTVEETQKLAQSGEAVVVDVRPKPQYDQSHIKGSISLPRTELDKRLGELPKDKLIIFYCA